MPKCDGFPVPEACPRDGKRIAKMSLTEVDVTEDDYDGERTHKKLLCGQCYMSWLNDQLTKTRAELQQAREDLEDVMRRIEHD